MISFLLVIAGFLFGTTAYQDFRYRAVSVWVLLLLIGVGINYGICSFGLSEFIMALSINSLYSEIILLIVLIYNFIKLGKPISSLEDCFGGADFIILIIIGMFMPAQQYVFFVLIGCVFSLFSSLMLFTFSNNDLSQQVPLAGYLSILAIMSGIYHYYLNFLAI